MKRASQLIEYDLAQDLIYYKDDEAVNKENGKNGDKTNYEDNNKVSLKEHSLILITAHFYKHNNIIDDISGLMNLILNNGDHSYLMKKWHDIELKVEIKFFESMFLVSQAFQLRIKIQEIVHFVGMQILEFLMSTKFLFFDEVLFLRHLKFTSQGTINLKKTIFLLDQCIYLTTIGKFALSCAFYVKYLIEIRGNEVEMSDIASLSPPGNTHYAIFHYKKCEKFPFCCNLTNLNISKKFFEQKDLMPLISSLLMKVFKDVVRNNNDVAAHCLWTDFFLNGRYSKKISKKILPLEVKSLKNANILVFLLLQLYNSKLGKYFESEEVLQSIKFIVSKIRWHSHLVKILNAFKNCFKDFFPSLIVLLFLIESHCTDYPVGIKLDVLKAYFKSIPAYVKRLMVPPYFEDLEASCYGQLLLKPFLKAKKDVVKLLFEPATYTELKSFFTCKNGINVLEEAIVNENLDFVDNILRSVFRKSDVLDIKRSMSSKTARKISNNFRKSYRFGKLFEFFDWWSDSLDDEKIRDYKLKILREKNGDLMKQILFNREMNLSDTPFNLASRALLWCFESHEKVSTNKKRIFLLERRKIGKRKFHCEVYDNITKSILNSEWSFLANFLFWKGSTSGERRKLGAQLINDKALIESIFTTKNNVTSFLTFFIFFLQNYLHLNDDDGVFKKKLFRIKFMRKLILSGKYNILNEIIDWCSPSKQQLIQFRKNIIEEFYGNVEANNWVNYVIPVE